MSLGTIVNTARKDDRFERIKFTVRDIKKIIKLHAFMVFGAAAVFGFVIMLVRLLRLGVENTLGKAAGFQVVLHQVMSLDITAAVQTSLLVEFMLGFVMAIQIRSPATAGRTVGISAREVVMLHSLMGLQLSKVLKLVTTASGFAGIWLRWYFHYQNTSGPTLPSLHKLDRQCHPQTPQHRQQP